jgi:hypothetical protein
MMERLPPAQTCPLGGATLRIRVIIFIVINKHAIRKFILIDFCLHRTKVDKNNQKTIAINYLFMKINQKIISQFFQLQNNLSFQIVFWLFCHQK